MYATALNTRLETSGIPRPSTRAGNQITTTASTQDTGRQAADMTRDLEHSPQAVSHARHLTQEFMDRSETAPEAAEVVMLVVSELVTNSVEHAQPPVMLHLHHETTSDRVWIGVTDGGPAPQEGDWASSCTDAEHGRGMTIIDALTDAHGTRNLSNGTTTHWARLHTT